jgi:Spy/CpxP family protein refolding chaperone
VALLLGSVAAPAGVGASDETMAAALQGPPSGPGRGSSPSSWEWWNDAEVQKELGLTPEKLQRINSYYTRRNTELRPMVHEFFRQSAELEKMTRDRVADESTYALQVLRVESVRARLSESRTLMLYRISRELTPEQNQKLQNILDRRFDRNRSRDRTPTVR